MIAGRLLTTDQVSDQQSLQQMPGNGSMAVRGRCLPRDGCRRYTIVPFIGRWRGEPSAATCPLTHQRRPGGRVARPTDRQCPAMQQPTRPAARPRTNTPPTLRTPAAIPLMRMRHGASVSGLHGGSWNERLIDGGKPDELMHEERRWRRRTAGD